MHCVHLGQGLERQKDSGCIHVRKRAKPNTEKNALVRPTASSVRP